MKVLQHIIKHKSLFRMLEYDELSKDMFKSGEEKHSFHRLLAKAVSKMSHWFPEQVTKNGCWKKEKLFLWFSNHWPVLKYCQKGGEEQSGLMSWEAHRNVFSLPGSLKVCVELFFEWINTNSHIFSSFNLKVPPQLEKKFLLLGKVMLLYQVGISICCHIK